MRTLSFGSFGLDVLNLQENLNILGFGYPQKFLKTGFYGVKTREAVTLLQKQNNLPQNGKFGVLEASWVNRRLIYLSALSFQGTDASPNDLAPDELGCADSVCGVLFKALKNPEIEWTVSTAQLYRQLSNSSGYMRVQTPLAGDIIVSPTGYGNGGLSNGHTGIVGENGVIYSNSSATGTFEQNFTLATWKDRYVGLGGYPMCFFRKL